MKLKVWCVSDIGLKRQRNEDSFLVADEFGLYAVADGMGGHRGGEVASSLAVQSIKEVFALHKKDSRRISPRVLMSEAYSDASHRIYEKSQEGAKELNGMGTTLVMAYHQGPDLFIGNVGDSRCYLFREGNIWQLTEDHSLLNEHLRVGLLAEADIDKFEQKNVITRSVGFESEVSCDIIERNLMLGDLFILCSDGLSGLVDDPNIAKICAQNPREEIAKELVKAAKANGGDDNVTVMVIYAFDQ